MKLTNETIPIVMYEINFNKKTNKTFKRIQVLCKPLLYSHVRVQFTRGKMNKINYIQRTLIVRGYFL